MRFSASAPGKAVLSGEYAVLQGAPAIAMAVDCRARVTAAYNRRAVLTGMYAAKGCGN